MKKVIILLVATFLLSSCVSTKLVPEPTREFRGFWVATVVNIDWPANGKDPIAKQKSDYLAILDFYEALHFNAAIVQIRTAGDAFYQSDYAPWSRFLTGTEGKAPNAQEDMLAWMIDETHKRDMEFHAWLNPYRATFDLKTEVLSETHDFNKHPDWMLKYGKKYYYNPGLPEVQTLITNIIDEIVTNYQVDAVHFDDYFYPYTITGEVFEDEETYTIHHQPQQSLEDWRRSNMDSLIKKSYQTIKAKKPWVQFGVSPFGVWRNATVDPKGSDTRAGQTTYDDLYADPLLWMQNDWVDYVIPQLYWSMDLSVASHKTLVDWWSKNANNTKIYIGNGPYKIRNNSDTAWNKKRELPNQINYARSIPNIEGNVFFSAKSLMKDNKDVTRFLKRKMYKKKVTTPN